MNLQTLIADDTTLSGAMPSDRTIQRLPSRVHRPSPKPPLASNTHDRSCSTRGSQPITCVTDITSRSLSWIDCSMSRKLRLRVHLHVNETRLSLSPPSQSPTSHSSGLSRW